MANESEFADPIASPHALGNGNRLFGTFISQLKARAEDSSIIGADEFLRHLLTPDPPSSQQQDTTLDLAGPIPDLDGDGRTDIVRVKYVLNRGIYGFDGTLLVEPLRGLDGASLWKKIFHIEEGFAVAHIARVGKKGASGLIIENFGITTANGSFQLRTSLSGLAGTGKRLWDHTFEPNSSTPGVTRDAPLTPRLFDGAPGSASDVLLGLATTYGVTAGLVHLLVAETRTVIIDGATGELLEEPGSETNWSVSPRPTGFHYQGWFMPDPMPGPDVSGDGRDDYVYVSARARNESRVSMRTTGDGGEIWASGAIPIGDFTTVYPFRDLTEDGIPDLYIGTVLDKEGDPDPLANPGTVTGVAGSDGGVLWQGTGREVTPLGDIDRDGRIDVGTWSTFLSSKSHWAGMRYQAFRADDGKRLYSVAYKLRYRGGGGTLFTFYGSAGDLTADSVPDFYFSQSLVQDNAPPQHQSRFVSGRSGRMIREAAEWSPLKVSLDGAGDDLARALFEAQLATLVVETSSGNTGERLWAGTYQLRNLAGGTLAALPFGALLSRDSCPDVAVLLLGLDAPSYVIALDGRDGSILWSRRLGGPPNSFVGGGSGRPRREMCGAA